MKLLVIQPKLEQSLVQLEKALESKPFVDAVLFPEGYLNEHVEQACELARSGRTVLIGGYRRMQDRPKDRAVIINREGRVVLDRAKYTSTTVVQEDGQRLGIILCDELVKQGVQGDDAHQVDLLLHPIGVGMFSEEQFHEWLSTAKRIAVQHQAMVIGTSHADGAFRGSDVSIPIAYCMDQRGEAICVCQNDVRSWIVDTVTHEVVFSAD